MTTLLTYITVIFLIIGIPSALAELVQPSRGQWIHWVLIASAVLAVLWIVRLIIWIRGKIEEKVSYRDMNVSPSKPTLEANRVPPPHGTFYVAPNGTTTDTTPFTTSETVETHEIFEPMKSQSPFEHSADFLTNQRINRLLGAGDITIKEAEATRQQAKNMDFLERESFLSAIEHRREIERQEHDSSPD